MRRSAAGKANATLCLTGCSLANNTATAGAGLDVLGGGLLNEGGATVNASTFSGNQALERFTDGLRTGRTKFTPRLPLRRERPAFKPRFPQGLQPSAGVLPGSGRFEPRPPSRSLPW